MLRLSSGSMPLSNLHPSVRGLVSETLVDPTRCAGARPDRRSQQPSHAECGADLIGPDPRGITALSVSENKASLFSHS